jgi:hypothetical protein
MDEIGLRQRETFNDARHLIIYGQRTVDGRFAFGGRGAPYHYGSAVKPAFDHDAATHDAIAATLRRLFPVVEGAAVTHRWGGPLGVARDWRCSVGLDREKGLAWAGGYVGDGVATTNLAGRTLADLIHRAGQPIHTRLLWVGPPSSRALGARARRRWLGSDRLAYRARRTRASPHRRPARFGRGHAGSWPDAGRLRPARRAVRSVSSLERPRDLEGDCRAGPPRCERR